MSMTNLTRNALLNYTLGKTTITAIPSTVYYGLSLTAIVPAGTGATEPDHVTQNYHRTAVTNDKSTGFTTSTVGSLTNVADVVFTQSTAAQGTVIYVFLADAATAGNILLYTALSPAITIQSSTTVTLAAGTITFTLD